MKNIHFYFGTWTYFNKETTTQVYYLTSRTVLMTKCLLSFTFFFIAERLNLNFINSSKIAYSLIQTFYKQISKRKFLQIVFLFYFSKNVFLVNQSISHESSLSYKNDDQVIHTILS